MREQKSYIIVYNFQTGDITAICDPNEILNTDLTHSFWSPDGGYIGYWSFNRSVIFDIQSGEVFVPSDSSISFVGWTNTGQNPSSTPIPTTIPIATLTSTATP